MGNRSYDDATKAAAVALAADIGLNEAARQTGCSAGALSAWAKRAGVNIQREQTAAAVEARVIEWEKHRVDLAHRAGSVAEQALTAAQAAIAAGKLRDAQTAATTMAILVDKAQLLTGAATSRSEHAYEPTEVVELRDKARRHLHAA